MNASRRLEATLLTRAEQGPDASLITHLGSSWTYQQVAQRAGAVAAWLREAGVRADDRVVLVLPNGPDYVIAYYGILLSGASVVAINPAAGPEEVEYVLRHSEAAAICGASGGSWLDVAARVGGLNAVLTTDTPEGASGPAVASLAGLGSVADPIPSCSPDQTRSLAQIIYTSGTTGKPKGVMLSHGNLHANTQSIVSYLGLTSDDSVLVILPFYYSYGNSLLQTHVAVGGRLVIARDFVFWNQALELAQQERVTGFSGVPMSYAMLLHRSDLARREFPHLRYMTCAGGALLRPMIERLREIIPHVQLFVMYGQTEASARLTSLLPHEVDLKPGSAGRAIPGVEITIRGDDGTPVPARGVGELVAQGENIMQGFWRDPDATAEVLRPDGLYTRDVGWMDEEGYIWIVGRKDDVIKSGSFRIGPEELEQVVLGIPGVREVAVVGEPDPFLGAVPVAFVVTDGQADAEAILAEAQRRLPRFKALRRVYLVPELPRTKTGKVRRGVLRDQLKAVGSAQETDERPREAAR
jgi:acyl-CoA synthetase (AMP-forming)/AMP-acid ligase II